MPKGFRILTPPRLQEGNPLGKPEAWVVLVHGGAGAPGAAVHALRNRGCQRAAQIGERLIASGMMSPLDVCVEMVAHEELDVNLIAAAGSGPNKRGRYQLDAFTMKPTHIEVVSAIGTVKHPVHAARLLQFDPSSWIITGQDATDLARQYNLPFYTHSQMDAAFHLGAESREGIYRPPTCDTVGAIVAAKYNGRWYIATAGSTGGMPDKEGGRVGDCGVPGAGFWAAERFDESIFEEGGISNVVAAALVSGVGEAAILNRTAGTWADRMANQRNSDLFDKPSDLGAMRNIVNNTAKGKRGWGGFAGVGIYEFSYDEREQSDPVVSVVTSQSVPWFSVACYTNLPSLSISRETDIVAGRPTTASTHETVQIGSSLATPLITSTSEFTLRAV